jgi:hypothetical protein
MFTHENFLFHVDQNVCMCARAYEVLILLFRDLTKVLSVNKEKQLILKTELHHPIFM